MNMRLIVHRKSRTCESSFRWVLYVWKDLDQWPYIQEQEDLRIMFETSIAAPYGLSPPSIMFKWQRRGFAFPYVKKRLLKKHK